MWSLPFIFFGWGFWAMYDFRVTPPLFTVGALCCFCVFVIGLLALPATPIAGFAGITLAWIVYGCLGAYLWASLDGDPRVLYPELLFPSNRK